jgi:hypothetical protein
MKRERRGRDEGERKGVKRTRTGSGVAVGGGEGRTGHNCDELILSAGAPNAEHADPLISKPYMPSTAVSTRCAMAVQYTAVSCTAFRHQHFRANGTARDPYKYGRTAVQ